MLGSGAAGSGAASLRVGIDGSGVIGTQAAANRTTATGIAAASALTLLSPCYELSQIDLASFDIRKQAGTSSENCGPSSALKIAGKTAGSIVRVSGYLDSTSLVASSLQKLALRPSAFREVNYIWPVRNTANRAKTVSADSVRSRILGFM